MADRIDLENKISDRLAQLASLLTGCYGVGAQWMEDIGPTHRDNILWLASDVCDEVQRMAEQLPSASPRNTPEVAVPNRGTQASGSITGHTDGPPVSAAPRGRRPAIPANAVACAAAACDRVGAGRQTLRAAIAALDAGCYSHQLSEHADRLLQALDIERFASAPTRAGAGEMYEGLHIVVAVMRGAWLTEKEADPTGPVASQLLAAWHAVDDGQTLFDSVHMAGLDTAP